MTSRSKTQIKSFFETGDQPTEAQFIDLIDSYVDKSGPLGTIETAASAGTVGVATFTGGAGTISSYASVLSAAGATVTTTAQAINALVSADPLTWYGSQTYRNTVNFEGKTQFSDDGRRTISSGSISILGTYHTVETQSSAATDDLDTISTTGSGLFTILRAESPDRTVVVKHNTGNILTPDGSDITLDETRKLVALLYDSDLAKWHVLARPPGSELPSGTILMHGASTPPTGFLECNGSAVSRTTYASLFAAIGTTWGVGDGSTTFNLPDMRGEFVRGWDNGRGVDAARAFASSQSDELEAHTHTYTTLTGSGGITGPALQANSATTGSSGTTNSTGGTETRPRNVAALYIIKT